MALPDEDAAEVARRFSAIEAELGAKTELGQALALRAAMLTVRMERSYRHEAACLSLAVDAAPKAYDDGRLAAVEGLVEGLRDDPMTNARRLQQTPEGLALTIDVWKALRLDLLCPDRKLWSTAHWERAENLLGRTTDDLPRSRIGALSRAMWFDFSSLEPGEASGLNEQGRYEYARDRLAEIIDGRIETLTALLASGRFDAEADARARAGAGDRALFDGSREAILARKYEAAAERSLFRTLREFREVESAAALIAEPAPGPAATDGPAAASGDLGSFFPDTPGPCSGASPATSEPWPGHPEAVPSAPEHPGSRESKVERAKRASG